ncbi:MAG TPA: hypothetical protein VGA01_19445 [Candidatus Binatia bacterium]
MVQTVQIVQSVSRSLANQLTKAHLVPYLCREGVVRIMAKYMSIPYEAALRTYDTSIPVFVSDAMLSEDFQDKVLDFEFNAMGMEKELPRNRVFDFSIMKSLATK